MRNYKITGFNRFFASWGVWVFLLCLPQVTLGLGSLDRPVIAWAGISLAGESDKLQVLYPRTTAYLPRANQELYRRVAQLQSSHYQLVTDDKVDLRRGNSLALTLALEDETVVVRKLAGLYQAVVELSASIVVYDVDSAEKAVIASFPLGLGPYIETYAEGPPGDRQLNHLVEGYLFGGLSNLDTGLLDQAVGILERAEIKYRYAAKIGIGQVDINEVAAGVMDASFGGDAQLMRSYIGRQTARLLSARYQVSVLPYQADNAIANMTLRFTGKKTTLLLRLPEPDFRLNIQVERFARKLMQESKHEQLYLYAARATFTIEDDFGDRLYQESIKDFVHKRILLTQPAIDEWAVYQGALAKLTRGLLDQMHQPDPDWLRLQGFQSKKRRQVESSLLAAAEVLEQCR
ncbi:MAG: hypothetical protein SV765_08935 [Pseudomonadota bacterium]|nr:hypothetical protein [Pseudomonadota bacterium]